MTNVIVKTDLLYVVKVVECGIMNLAKAHIVDDYCNEYIAIIKLNGCSILKGYYKPRELDIIDLETYNSDEFNALCEDVEILQFIECNII